MTRWPFAVIALHWIGAGLILSLLGIGWAMSYAGLDMATSFDLYQAHKSLGFAALAVTTFRLGVRAWVRAPGRSTGSPWEQGLAAATQALLYVFTVGAIFAGWVTISSSTFPMQTVVFGLFTAPDLVGPNEALNHASTRAHQILVYTVAALVALHVAGAIKHAAWNRDGTMARMWPRRRR